MLFFPVTRLVHYSSLQTLHPRLADQETKVLPAMSIILLLSLDAYLGI